MDFSTTEDEPGAMSGGLANGQADPQTNGQAPPGGSTFALHARIRGGDPEAFRELFRAHSRQIHRYALRVSADWAAAEDVVALVFLEAWRLRAKLRDEGATPAPWLMGIAVNVLRNRARAARRHDRALARLPARDSLPDFADELVQRMADAERLAAAKVALNELRRGEREVFTLCVWSGLSYADAALALGVPVGTVRSRLARARDRLRQLTERQLKKGGVEQPEPTGRHRTEITAEPGDGSGQGQGGRTDATRSLRTQEEWTR